MVSKEDLNYIDRENDSRKYGIKRFARLKTLYQNPNYRNFTIKSPEKVKNIYGGDVIWVDSPEKDRASVGLIYVQTLDGRAAFPAPWEAKGGLTDWYHFREILRFGIDAVGAARNMRRGNNNERPLLLSFYDPELVKYRTNELQKGRHPLGVIITGSGNIDNGIDHLAFRYEGKSVIFTSKDGLKNLESVVKGNSSMSVEVIGKSPRELDMKEMLRILKSKYKVERFLALGGPGFSTDLIKQDCVDNYFINIAPTLSGDNRIKSFFSAEESLPRLVDLELVSLKISKENTGEGGFTLYPHYIPKR
ncbi:dihydrofolate reductase family protein [Candidatus Woesearchaeota archaeon]|nr:dihydrofolate reductase family protein [Candidatus Woesearchaeota archaeon]